MAVRKRAVHLIKEARGNPQQLNVCQFHPPRINFSGEYYPDLIEWQNVTRPPALRDITDQELEEAVEDFDFVERLPAFPCHTQAVQRTVQLVTRASIKVTFLRPYLTVDTSVRASKSVKKLPT
ncbi:Trigger factor [Frankliniella fusca]|uniref:Trigger factor n=1 Tax=Frankliniella fusca TaxID=407009 RepID=A0AAE1LHR9_9NEOP|nr:Trigger factor [Frankliniella fusca]